MLWEQRTFVSSSFSFFSFLFFVSSSFSLFSFLFFTNNSFLKKNKHFFIFEKKTNNNNNNNNGSGAPGGVKIDFSSYWLPCLRDEEKETHIKDVVGTTAASTIEWQQIAGKTQNDSKQRRTVMIQVTRTWLFLLRSFLLMFS